jgi:hypothetical protein
MMKTTTTKKKKRKKKKKVLIAYEAACSAWCEMFTSDHASWRNPPEGFEAIWALGESAGGPLLEDRCLEWNLWDMFSGQTRERLAVGRGADGLHQSTASSQSVKIGNSCAIRIFKPFPHLAVRLTEEEEGRSQA